MNLGPIYDFYGLLFNGVGCILNLFLVGLFFHAYRRHRHQLGFPILAFSSLCFVFTTAYHFASRVHQRFTMDVFPPDIWRIFAWVFIIAQPLGFLACFIGPVVLVRTYERSTPK